MRKILKLTVIAVAAIIFTSCNNATEESVWNGELLINSAISTRATEQTWAANDAIGVYMCTTSTTSAIGVGNSEYMTTESGTSVDFAVAEGVTPLYYPQDGNVDIYAYYPFSTSVSAMSYPLDVTTQSSLPAIDLMIATQSDVARSKSALNLNFSHKLSQVVVTLSPATDGGLTDADLASATVTLSGLVAKGDYGLSDNSISFGENVAEDIEFIAASSVATAIVIPQTVTPEFTISVANIGEFVVTASEITLVGGSQHNYAISVSKMAANLSGSTISPWGDGAGESLDAEPPVVEASSAAIGDYYYSDGTWSTDLDENKEAIGVIFSVGTDGTSGKVVSLDESSDYLYWSTEWVTTNAISTSDGLANMATIQSLDNTFSSYPPFAWVDAKNSSGTTYASGAKGVWYLPAYQELQELYAGMSGLQWVASDAGNGEINDWGTGSSMPSYSSYADARTVFNALITSASGTAISTGYYWSSTEYGDNVAWSLVFYDGGYVYNFIKDNDDRVRAVLAF